MSGYLLGDDYSIHLFEKNVLFFGNFSDLLIYSFNRLWDRPEKNLTNHIQPPRAKVNKPKSKSQKADSVETETTVELIDRLSLTDFFIDEQPYATLFSIFQACFLDQSVLRGVIYPQSLTLSAKHDSHGFCEAFLRFLDFLLAFKPSRLTLDSAHT